MRTVTKDDKMTLQEFLQERPAAVSKVKFAEMIGAESVGAGMGVIYFNWPQSEQK